MGFRDWTMPRTRVLEGLGESIRGGYVIAPVLFLLLVLFFLLSQQGYISDSEIWAVTVSKQFSDPSTLHASIFSKLLFHYPLYALFSLSSDNVSLLLHARLLFAFVGASIVGLMAWLSWTIWRDRLAVSLAVLFLLSSPMFLNQAYRVRPDFLATAFSLGLLILFFAQAKRAHLNLPWLRGIGFGVLSLLIFLTTPKVALFVVAQTALFIVWILGANSSERKPRLFFLGGYLGTLHFTFSAALLWITITGRLPQMIDAYRDAAKFFWNSFAEGGGYMTGQSLVMVKRFALLNPLLAGLIVAGWGAGVYRLWTRFRGRSAWKATDPYRAFYVIFLLVVFAHNQLTSYFIAAVLPFFLIYSGYLVAIAMRWFVRTFPIPERVQLLLLIIVCFIASAKAIYAFRLNVTFNANHAQLSTIADFEEYLAKYPDATHYDVIGILPRKNSIYAFLGPGQDEQNKKIAKKMYEWKPDIFLHVEKAIYIENGIFSLLNREYVSFQNGAWARALVIRPRDLSAQELKEKKSAANAKEGFQRMQSGGLWRNAEALGGHTDEYVLCKKRVVSGKSYCQLESKKILEQYRKVFAQNDKEIFVHSLNNMDVKIVESPILQFKPSTSASSRLKTILDAISTQELEQSEAMLVPVSTAEIAFTRYAKFRLPANQPVTRLFGYDWDF